ncbi:putative prophage Lp4 protein 7, DNA replication [Nocardioidaceae bacterium Broad-1]|nr:putative prophage Lp4 protein 7, DNA replication [Nocardioidaceae bacterium Broad-1]
MNEPSTSAARWPAAVRDAASAGSLVGAAATLANAGIPVFPCVPGAKQPLTAHGFKSATAAVEQVNDWWSKSPTANIGIPTGAVSGIAVVDVDVHGADSGFTAFNRAHRAGLVDAWELLVRTPSGGLHAYFSPAKAEMRSWSLPAQHLDFRGDGGYIVAPPSRITTPDGERSYGLIAVAQHESRPLDADRLRTFLEPVRIVQPPASLTRDGVRPDRLAAWVANRPEGARNQGLFWAACRLAETGQRYDVTLATLGKAASSAGLPYREAETTIRSAFRIALRLGPDPDVGSRPGPTRPSEAVAL